MNAGRPEGAQTRQMNDSPGTAGRRQRWRADGGLMAGRLDLRERPATGASLEEISAHLYRTGRKRSPKNIRRNN